MSDVPYLPTSSPLRVQLSSFLTMFVRPVRFFTAITDFLLINLAFAFAYVVRYEWQWLQPVFVVHPYPMYYFQQGLYCAIILVIFYQNKVWQRRRGEFWVDQVSHIVYSTSLATAIMIAYIFIFMPVPFSRLMWVWVPFFIVFFLSVARLGRRLVLNALYRRGILVDQALVIGAGETGRSLIRMLLARPDLGFQTIGYLQDKDAPDGIGSGRIPPLGIIEDLPRVLREYPNLHTVFIALPGHYHHQIMELIRVCTEHGLRAQVAPDLFQLSLNQVESSNMGGIPILTTREVRLSRMSHLAKRVMDLTVVLLGAIPALFVGAVIAIAIKIETPGPVFYAAERVGKNGRPFQMIKFRSMVVDAENQKKALEQMNEASGPIFKIKDDPRLTKVGRLIRRLSLDELPQLWNVLVGEMSIVGPRPPLAEEVAQYQEWHKQRLTVLGGLTGLWQVSGRSDLTFDEQCLLDIYYIENWSLSQDVRIMFQTVPYALFGRGAY